MCDGAYGLGTIVLGVTCGSINLFPLSNCRTSLFITRYGFVNCALFKMVKLLWWLLGTSATGSYTNPLLQVYCGVLNGGQ